MKQPQKSAAEAEAKRYRGLGLKAESRVVELQFFKSVFKVAVLCSVHRIDSAEYHRLSLAVSGKRLGGGVGGQRHRVADRGVGERLDRARDITYLAGVKTVGLFHLRCVHKSALNNIENAAGSHQLELVAGVYLTFLESDVNNNALIAVVVAVKNQRAKRSVYVAGRRGDICDDFFEHGVDIDSRLCGYLRSVLGGYTDNVFDLADDPFGFGARQVDLVDNGNYLKPAVNRQICVGKCLRFDSLRSVNNKDRALARRK